MNAALTPNNSPRVVRRRGSVRRPRAGSHLPPFSQESHDAALYAIRHYLKGRTSYDTFPVSFRLIVLDSKLEVKKALQCLLLNGILTHVMFLFCSSHLGLSLSLRCRFCTVMEQ